MKTCTWCGTVPCDKGWFVRIKNVLWMSCRVCSCTNSDRPTPTIKERMSSYALPWHEGSGIALVLIKLD